MRIPFGWLQNYVKIDVSPQEACLHLIMLGFSDAEVIPNEWECLDNFVVGRATEVKPHPKAPHLKVVRVNLGYTDMTSVCGAPNVVEGGTYAVALPGARLGGGQTVSRAEIDGVASDCVLCSGWEAWLDDSKDTLLELDHDLVPGARLLEALGLDEPVIEAEVTPNRGDCLGLIGIARELAAVFGKELIIPEPAPKYCDADTSEVVSVEISDVEGCPRYGAIALEGVRVRSSSASMRARLRLAGLRPINNVVDAANFVMFETGHPLHAFDLDRITDSSVIVRRAREQEKIEAIDGKQYNLTPDDLVIADAARPIAIAGVIGGKNSEVSDKTSRVLVEGAFFEKSLIWRTSKRLTIPSEAAYRFARGVDIEAIPYVLARAAEIIQEDTGCRVARSRVDVYPQPRPARYVIASPKRINKLLGTSIPEQEICDYLERLGFVVTPGRELDISVPTRRDDVEAEADIAEEVARLYGYDRIPPAEDRACRSHGKISQNMLVSGYVRRVLKGMGFTEVVTDTMVSPETLELFNMTGPEVVEIRNPVGVNASLMRTSLIPGILDVLVRNEYRGEEGVAVFEVGKVYSRTEDNFIEGCHLVLGLSGLREARAWYGRSRSFDFFDIKGVLEAVLADFGISVNFEPDGPAFLHPGRSALVQTDGGELGLIGEILPDIASHYGSKRRLYVAEIDFEPLVQRGLVARRMRQRPRYPAVKRDIAVVVPKTVLDMEIRSVILHEGGDLIESVETFDLYEGRPIPKGKKSLAYAIAFRHPSRTLKESEIDEIQQKIEMRISKELGGSIRKQSQ